MRAAVQLYTLRDLLEENLTGTLAAVKSMGYEYVETAGLYGRTPEEFRSELDHAGLKAIASHVGLSDLESHLEHEARVALAVGAAWLVVPWIAEADYEQGWDKFAQRLSTLGERCLAAGVRLAYHNHEFEFANQGYALLWDNASEVVEAELDLYWVHRSGNDPSRWLRNLAGRVPLAHFKDGKAGKFTPVGEGELPWPDIIESARLAGVEYAIVELDTCPRDPLECVRSSLQFLNKLGVSS